MLFLLDLKLQTKSWKNEKLLANKDIDCVQFYYNAFDLICKYDLLFEIMYLVKLVL